MANEIHPVKSWLRLYAETTWGTKPGTPTYVPIPVESYGVMASREHRNPGLFTGLRQRKSGRAHRATVAGEITTPLFGWRPSALTTKSLAEYMFDWALASPEALELPSVGAEWFEGPDVANKGHSGLRVNSATVSGSSDGGNVMMSVDVIGQDEDGNTVVPTGVALETNMYKVSDFEFEDVVFSLDDGAGGALVAIDIKSFEYGLNNNLTSEFLGNSAVQLLLAGDREETLTVEFPRNSEVYDALARSTDDTFFVAKLEMQGLHEGTGVANDYAKVTLDMGCLRYINHEGTRDRESISMNPIEFELLKPDTADDALKIAWSEV